MAERIVLKEGLVDFTKGPVKVPDELPMTISAENEIDLNQPPRDMGEWIIRQVMATGEVLNLVADHQTREVRARTE